MNFQEYKNLPSILGIKHTFCYHCFKVPSISIDDSFTTITMNCEECKHKAIIPISKFVSVCAHADTKDHLCPHNIIGFLFCIDCQHWFCHTCLEEHSNENHIIMKVADYRMNEITHCACSEEARYYCHECKAHFCNRCKQIHINHDYQDVIALIDSGEKEGYKEIIKDINKYMNYRKELKVQAIDYLQQRMNQIEEAYEKNQKTNEYLLQLFQILLNSYSPFHPNYYAAMNIINNSEFDAKEFDRPISDIGAVISFFNQTHIMKPKKKCLTGLKEMTLTQSKKAHKDWIGDLLLLNDGRIVSCSGDKTIQIYNRNMNSIDMTLTGHEMGVRYLSQLDNGLLLSASIDCNIKVWDINKTTDQCIATLKGHEHWLRKVIPISKNRIASCGQDGTYRIWEASAPYSCIKTVKLEKDDCISIIELKYKENTLVTVEGNSSWFNFCENCTMTFWDGTSYEKKVTIQDVECSSKNGLIEYKNRLLVGGNGRITTVSIESQQIENIVDISSNDELYICTLVDIGNDIILFGDQKGKVNQLNMKTFEVTDKIQLHKGMIYKIIKTGDNSYASGCEDGYLSLWEAHSFFEVDYKFRDGIYCYTLDSRFNQKEDQKEYNENSIFPRLQGLIDPFLARFEDNDIIL